MSDENIKKEQEQKPNLIVQRRNIFNEMTGADLSIHEIRFLFIIFALLNPKNENITDVYFPEDTYLKVLGIDRIKNLKEITEHLYNLSLMLPTGPNGAKEAHHLMRVCGSYYDPNFKGTLFHFGIDPTSASLFFNYTRDFTQFPLGGPFLLERDTHMYLYTNLKEHEYKGEWEPSLEEFKIKLQLENTKYEWRDIQKRILRPLQEKFKSASDIIFEYKPIQTGRQHAVTHIHFDIFKNPDWENPFDDEEIRNTIKLANKNAIIAGKKKKKEIFDTENNNILSAEERESICEGAGDYREFDIFTNVHEFKLAVDYAKRLVERDYQDYLNRHKETLGNTIQAIQWAVCDFLKEKLWEIDRLNMQREKGVSDEEPIKDKVAYLLAVLKNEINRSATSESPKESKRDEPVDPANEYDDGEDEPLLFGINQ